MLYKQCSAIILAAGKGSRMLSDTPKVMHKIGGKYMLQHLVDTILKIGIQSIYIVYHDNDYSIMQKIISIASYKVSLHWILQRELLGTGHAVRQVLSVVNNNEEEIFILNGDVPLVSCATLQKLHFIKSQCDVGLLTAMLTNPAGYGRVIRNKQGKIINIIEDDDDITCDDYQEIREVNTGILISTVGDLKCWLEKLIIHSVKNEFYLTDIVNIAHRMGCIICDTKPIDTFEIIGINSKSDLVYLDRKYQIKQAQYLLSTGVMISDPYRFDLRGTLICGKDVFIDINVIIEGHVSLGNRVKIGANCLLKDITVGDDVVIYPFSIIENTIIYCKSEIGPFARLRLSTILKEKSCVGNFVELKNVQLGNRSKVKHLSYLGDAEIGSQVNIGAGVIICNYDGEQKHHTDIRDNVFIGSNSQLVAPLTIEKNAIIGAGTTVTQDVLENETVISRIRQFSIVNRKRLKK